MTEGKRSQLLSPAKRQRAVEHVRGALGCDRLSECRACFVMGQSRNSGTNCWNGKPLTRFLRPRVLFVRWRQHYKTIRPHSSLGYRPPAPEACLLEGKTLT